MLNRGDSVVIPLFYDQGGSSHREILSRDPDKFDYAHISLNPSTITLHTNPNSAEFIVGFFVFSGEKLMDMVDMVTVT